MSAQNWVVARANCTPADNMTELVKRLKKDIRSYNGLSSDKRGKRQFKADLENGELVIRRMVESPVNTGGHYVVEDEDYIGDVIRVRRDDATITACRADKAHVEIVPDWNPETQACDLKIDGKPLPVWRVSELILGEFLFES
ncbi:MAG: hypothetical protein OXM58_12320 [Rhodospirillaceae bacterium]|nr:hypothetical protein [Rhodospirillaceae bacterium]MDE0616388.1 hypothetical protein [Rhodospirillaceae bacterium]